MRLILTAAAAAIVLSASYAQAANIALQNQFGTGHTINVLQTTTGHSLNLTETRQSGNRHISSVNQNAVQDTFDAINDAYLEQYGDSNVARTNQSSLSGLNISRGIQDGVCGSEGSASCNEMDVNQKAEYGVNTAVTVQVGQGNRSQTKQAAIGKRGAVILPLNQSVLVQAGNDNQSNLEQQATGSAGNTSGTSQSGDGHVAKVTQTAF